MAILVVGADRLGNINKELNDVQCEDVIHWRGRDKMSSKKYIIPSSVDKVIIFYDFINHNLMNSIKRQAKKNSLPIIYSKRALSDLQVKL
jgi:hypothetical protein